MPGEPQIVPAERADVAVHVRDLVALADRQHGRVHRRQLADLGWSSSAIGRLVARGWLQREHRGVFVVGHRSRTLRGRWMGAVLLGGPGAALSHRAAAALHGVRPPVDRIDVTAPGRRTSSRGLRFHESVVAADERIVVDGIPVTSMLRTLLDLAATEGFHTTERAAHEAEARHLTDALSPERFLARHTGERGTRILSRVLNDPRLGLDVTESPLEDRFLRFLDEHGLPRPHLNVWIDGRRCDAVWPHARLIAELDGRSTHETAPAFEDDRARDRALLVAGWTTTRITHRQLTTAAGRLAADLRALTA